MACSVRDLPLPKPQAVRVNGVEIARADIARETQYHPGPAALEAWTAATRALIVRELLLQEAHRLDIEGEARVDAEGRREAREEMLIRLLMAREVTTPEPDEETCRRFYDNNRRRFRSPALYEAAHILFAARRDETDAFARAQELAKSVLDRLTADPSLFEAMARAHSACPSAAEGGVLGQITPGSTTPEFERALAQMTPGTLCAEPVETRYGVHIIRLDRHHDGHALPYAAVRDRIAGYLRESVQRRAAAQYVARLAGRARIEGITLPGPEALATSP